ncbi:hypothetical protein BDZ91DRAFT_848060 [Kalaharituber pfeilii]|nr:hypothetical protein BDZ91DRAFT_848060 [Kalaharituber pfeilii]
MLGNTEPEFIKMINGTFIALVCACIYHLLGIWVEGEFNEPPDFNYANSFRYYRRIYDQWRRDFNGAMQRQLLNIIKGLIVEKIAAVCKPRAIKRGLPYAVSDEHQKAYAQRLADASAKASERLGRYFSGETIESDNETDKDDDEEDEDDEGEESVMGVRG